VFTFELIVYHFKLNGPRVSGLTALRVPWHRALYCMFLIDLLFLCLLVLLQ